ncbi:MAG: beta-ketoacyl synthase N-terminal-like domain-containing protein [Caldilineaceae bacterium]
MPYIFDAIRTPRGKGRASGAARRQARGSGRRSHAARCRRATLDTAQIDDVILGCVTPVGEQGADIARTAALLRGVGPGHARYADQRFCASGLEAVNLAAMKVRAGWEQLVVAGGVESMSRVPMARRRRPHGRSRGERRHRLCAPRHQRRPHRHAGGLQPGRA